MPSLSCRLIALFLLLTASAQALAADWGREELMALLATPEGGERRYTETRELAFLESPEVSRGRLIFSPPDQLVKQVDNPDSSRFEITDDTMTISRPGQADQIVDVDDYPVLRAFVDTLRAILTGDLKSLEQHYSLKLIGTRNAWQLHLSPLDEQLAVLIESLTINGRDKHIEQMVTRETGGDRTTLTLHSSGE